MTPSLLIVDDDAKLREQLTDYLEANGHVVHTLDGGLTAAQETFDLTPDLVILDLMMPDRDGLDVLRDIRSSSSVPVIILTARGEDTERIIGLELGADDYLAKPFNPRELLARIRAVLRRSREARSGHGPELRITRAGITLDTARQIMTIGDESTPLAPTESRLLATLMQSPNKPLSRDQLMASVWERDFSAFDRSIDVYVSKVRGALKSYPEHRDRIRTVWGTGYMFLDD